VLPFGAPCSVADALDQEFGGHLTVDEQHAGRARGPPAQEADADLQHIEGRRRQPVG
jgi:hypothetical protein